MDWEYILASIKNRDRQGDPIYYSLPELVDQYNNEKNTKFVCKFNYLSAPNSCSCYLKTLDGMCGVMIVHRTAIHSRFFPEWMPLLQFLAEKGNYTKIMVTNVVGDKINAWKALDFKTISAFRNKRTGNDVEILMKDV